MSNLIETPLYTVKQIIGTDDKAFEAVLTSSAWVGLPGGGDFALPTTGNSINAYVTAAGYFEDLAGAIDGATQSVYISGWQINWDTTVTEKGRRLYDLIYDAAARGVTVYVMPWDDTEPVQTYDDQTKVMLEDINKRLNIEGDQRRVRVGLSASFAKTNNSYYSHHQKMVVIDRRIAFVGGMDVAYGRFDDNGFSLKAASSGREVLNRYNPCVPPMQALPTEDTKGSSLIDPDYLTGMADKFGWTEEGKRTRTKVDSGSGWQVPYQKAGLNVVANSAAAASNTHDLRTLDEKRQPRMPWHDVHCRIEGPAVSDLLRNFVLRWNAQAAGDKQKLNMPVKAALWDASNDGKASIQVLRSAPQPMREAEYKAIPKKEREGVAYPGSVEDTIERAMMHLIDRAQHYIYIEQQFFVSAFGSTQPNFKTTAVTSAATWIRNNFGSKTTSGMRVLDETDQPDRLPQNMVLGALINRLRRAILDVSKRPFHVYIVLPVHPEGALTDATIAAQVYWTMQSLVHGSNSLLNGVRRAIYESRLRQAGDKTAERVSTNLQNTEWQAQVSLEDTAPWVTLLNLRNWEKLGENYVTEQVYVHSKLMIVDDAHVLLGSANINDRSLLGQRDSELAVLVQDEEVAYTDLNCTGVKNNPVRKFAHALRVKLWKKHFGLRVPQVRPAFGLEKVMGQPARPSTRQAIQKQAAANSALYEAAFDFIPRSKVRREFIENGKKVSRLVPSDLIPNWSDAGGAHSPTFQKPSKSIDDEQSRQGHLPSL